MEVPFGDLERYLDAPDLPAEIEALTTQQRGNQMFIKSVPADESIGKYTPTATLRATITDARVYEYNGTRSRTEPSTPDDEPPPSSIETFANFKGRVGTVIKNTALKPPMFEVLVDIARLADRGRLTAIVDQGGSLTAIAIKDGDRIPVSIEVVGREESPMSVDSPGREDTHP